MRISYIINTLLISAALLAPAAFAQSTTQPPNIIYILADDLGYGDLGCYGQQVTQTPRLDRMAAEGLRFTEFYAGATVCAPSRCVLMTGQHLGHCHVRGNGSQNHRQSLRDEDVTVAEVLKSAGYATALIGKWGLGEIDEPGHPLKQGFDFFYGYLNQGHAHNYYPDYLWRNTEKEPLPNVVHKDGPGGWATERVVYSQDRFMEESLAWIKAHREGPFFLYLAFTLPHANNEAARGLGNGTEVPDLGIYKDKDWPEPDKGQAAMISYLDTGVGQILDQLEELGIAKNTLVLFTSDNGPHNEANHDPLRFNPSGPLRGMKRDLYEGGIREPMLAWWPGTVAGGGVTDHVAYAGDLMDTVRELTGAKTPENLDSISFLPTVLGKPGQREHDYLYWEFYEQGSSQAVRWGNWKAVRKPMLTGPIEVYEVDRDAGEKYNLYRKQDIVHEARKLMDQAHVDHPNWPVPGREN